jgi:cbb3-type cytochrome oxidase subunit 1
MVERFAPTIKTLPVSDSLGVIMIQLEGLPLTFTDHCLDTNLPDWVAFTVYICFSCMLLLPFTTSGTFGRNNNLYCTSC